MRRTSESVQSLDTAAPLPQSIQKLAGLFDQAGINARIDCAWGPEVQTGSAPPRVRLTVKTPDALPGSLNELAFAQAYVDQKIDIEGDMLHLMDVRGHLRNRLSFAQVWGFLSGLVQPLVTGNRKAISRHYDLGDDFYLGFIDQRYRFYSHGIFESESETIEEASEHKLETMYQALQLKPGMRLLDVGGGWGGVAQYCGERGVHVTALTIARDSHAYMSRLVEERRLPAEVRLQDFFEHQPDEPYDALVIYGVIEHIPDYQRFARRAWQCLKPGALLYLDASAAIEKYWVSAFSRRYIWPGKHTFLCLQDLLKDYLYNGFDVVEVSNESRDYELTMRQWGARFDDRRDEIVERWGETVYRAFRLYLWGGSRAFHDNRLQAYHVVSQRREDPGPRPGFGRRLVADVKAWF